MYQIFIHHCIKYFQATSQLHFLEMFIWLWISFLIFSNCCILALILTYANLKFLRLETNNIPCAITQRHGKVSPSRGDFSQAWEKPRWHSFPREKRFSRYETLYIIAIIIIYIIAKRNSWESFVYERRRSRRNVKMLLVNNEFQFQLSRE